ncbi:hypothetical protein [Allorhodopirellula solitaria]|uniref:hypothetical protein n=1 Tax=Allorhodopirellula solitaria TaxID=2527987 RepID=UPI001646375D|nr:hypothetical protein [Allorhodopirellula solitaria]
MYTTPEPYGYEQSLDFLIRIAKGLKAIAHAITVWNARRIGKPSYRVLEYGLGLHMRPCDTPESAWSHLHLTMVTGQSVRPNTDGVDGLAKYLNEAFWHAVDFDQQPACPFKSMGTLAKKSLSEVERQRQHRGKTVTFVDLQKMLTYGFNLHKPGDSAETIALRNRLLWDANLTTTLTHSRVKRGQLADPADCVKKRSQPHLFDPVALGKEDVLVFDFDEQPPRPIAAEQWRTELKQLKKEARTRLETWTPRNLTIFLEGTQDATPTPPRTAPIRVQGPRRQ